MVHIYRRDNPVSEFVRPVCTWPVISAVVRVQLVLPRSQGSAITHTDDIYNNGNVWLIIFAKDWDPNYFCVFCQQKKDASCQLEKTWLWKPPSRIGFSLCFTSYKSIRSSNWCHFDLTNKIFFSPSYWLTRI